MRDPSDVARYTVQVARTDERTPLAWTTEATSLDVGGLPCGGAFRWRARATDGAGNDGAWSEWGAFATLAPPRPALIAYFRSSDKVVTRGSATRVRWATTGAGRARIEPLGRDVSVPDSACVAVTPDRTTEYVLRAVGEDREVRSASVTVADRVSEPTPPTRPADSAGLVRPLPGRIAAEVLQPRVPQPATGAVQPASPGATAADQSAAITCDRQRTTLTWRFVPARSAAGTRAPVYRVVLQSGARRQNAWIWTPVRLDDDGVTSAMQLVVPVSEGASYRWSVRLHGALADPDGLPWLHFGCAVG